MKFRTTGGGIRVRMSGTSLSMLYKEKRSARKPGSGDSSSTESAILHPNATLSRPGEDIGPTDVPKM